MILLQLFQNIYSLQMPAFEYLNLIENPNLDAPWETTANFFAIVESENICHFFP